MSLHHQDRDGSLGLRQTQAPSLGPPGEAGGLEEEGDQRGTGNGGGMDDHWQFVMPWYNLGEHWDLLGFVLEVFWVWVFS